MKVKANTSGIMGEQWHCTENIQILVKVPVVKTQFNLYFNLSNKKNLFIRCKRFNRSKKKNGK